eukprot:SAG22_NODE_20383_length_266_cov_0.622754_1_plen_55_part_10
MPLVIWLWWCNKLLPGTTFGLRLVLVCFETQHQGTGTAHVWVSALLCSNEELSCL